MKHSFPIDTTIRQIVTSRGFVIDHWKKQIADIMFIKFAGQNLTHEQAFKIIKEVNETLETFDWEDHPNLVKYSKNNFALFWKTFFGYIRVKEDFSNAVLAQFMPTTVLRR